MATITEHPSASSSPTEGPRRGDTQARQGARRYRRLIRHALLIVAGVVMLYPILWMFSSSFKPQTEIFGSTSLWPSNFTLENYAHGWNALQYQFGLFFWNSLLVAVAAVVGNVVTCSMAAFALARLNFRGKKLVFAIVLGTIMLPYHVVVVPQYVMFSAFGWVNTFWPLIVPKLLATDAFFIFLMVQFIRALPRELDEAARLDGCSPYQTYFRVIMPLTLPALVTTAIFTFIWTWNDFFTPLIYLLDPAMHTVPLALRAFMDSTGQSAFGSLFAMSVLSLGPIIGFFIAAQRHLVEGIATTGTK